MNTFLLCITKDNKPGLKMFYGVLCSILDLVDPFTPERPFSRD